MDSNDLIAYDHARSLIERIATSEYIKDVLDIADQAKALASYRRVADDQQMATWVAEVRIRAKRRIGEISASLPRNTGVTLPNVELPSRLGKLETLKSAGVSKDEAHRCEKIARVPEVDFEAYLNDAKANRKPVSAEEMTKALLKKEQKAAVQQKADRPDVLVVDDLGELAASGKKFGTIYADPPWLYDDQGTRGATSNHYVGMSTQAIADLPVASLAAEKAHLHLWTTNAFLFEAKEVMERWGFKYKGCYLWVKPQMGMGSYWRVSHEFMLLGVRGGCTFNDKSLKSWGEFDRGRHSAKPDEVRSLIERSSPGSRLELFGRKPVDGWVVWGNEIERSAFNDAAFQKVA